MQHVRRCLVVVLAAVGLIFGSVVSNPWVALADSKPVCAAELNITPPSVKSAVSDTPIITVHGLHGEGRDFEPIAAVIRSIGNVVVENFNYKPANDRWVTDGETAQRLAKTIVCYSKLYGDKPVTLLAHSMGGLLVREVLDRAVYGTFVKKVVGHIITIGTPHTGSILANADSSFWIALCKAPIGIFSLTKDIDSLCRQADWGRATSGLSINSEQLAQLPKFPQGITVKAIAGNAQLRRCTPWGCAEGDTQGDLVVPVKSATDEYTDTGIGDGKKVFVCSTITLIAPITDAWCEHGHMLHAPQVQAEVKASIQAHLDSVKAKAKPTTQFTSKLTLPHLQIPTMKTWELQQSDQMATAIDLSTCKRTSEGDFWKLCAHFTVEVDSNGRKGIWASVCADKLLATSKGKIGGKEATVYKYGRCDAYESPGVAYLWHVPGSVSVEYHLSDKDQAMAGFEEALAGATWK